MREKSESITKLDDEEFTVLVGYLVQNTSFQLALECENILSEIEDKKLKAFLARLRDELRSIGLYESERCSGLRNSIGCGVTTDVSFTLI